MSLSVSVYVRGASGEMNFVEPESDSAELAGFESYRTTLYGSQAAKSLGLTLLPSLATHDVFAEGTELERLRRESELALANIDKFVAESGAPGERLRCRFENIIAAVDKARRLGGGVVIW